MAKRLVRPPTPPDNPNPQPDPNANTTQTPALSKNTPTRKKSSRDSARPRAPRWSITHAAAKKPLPRRQSQRASARYVRLAAIACCARLGRVAPLGDLVGLLATWVGGGIGAALLAPPRDADEHALLWLLLVGREDLPCRRLVGSDGPCNEIVRRVYIKRSAGAGAGGRGGKDWSPRTFEQQLCPPRRVGSSALH